MMTPSSTFQVPVGALSGSSPLTISVLVTFLPSTSTDLLMARTYLKLDMSLPLKTLTQPSPWPAVAREETRSAVAVMAARVSRWRSRMGGSFGAGEKASATESDCKPAEIRRANKKIGAADLHGWARIGIDPRPSAQIH